jgi:hypothetical protein
MRAPRTEARELGRSRRRWVPRRRSLWDALDRLSADQPLLCDCESPGGPSTCRIAALGHGALDAPSAST